MGNQRVNLCAIEEIWNVHGPPSFLAWPSRGAVVDSRDPVASQNIRICRPREINNLDRPSENLFVSFFDSRWNKFGFGDFRPFVCQVCFYLWFDSLRTPEWFKCAVNLFLDFNRPESWRISNVNVQVAKRRGA